MRFALEPVIRIKAREHRFVVFVGHIDAQVSYLLLETNVVEHFDVLPLVRELHHSLVKRLVWILVWLLVFLSRNSVFNLSIFARLKGRFVALTKLRI